MLVLGYWVLKRNETMYMGIMGEDGSMSGESNILCEDTFSVFVLQKCVMGMAFIQTFLNFIEMLWVMVIVYVFKINIRGVCCDIIIIKDYLIVHENKL
jgi:hypothetical protein